MHIFNLGLAERGKLNKQRPASTIPSAPVNSSSSSSSSSLSSRAPPSPPVNAATGPFREVDLWPLGNKAPAALVISFVDLAHQSIDSSVAKAAYTSEEHNTPCSVSSVFVIKWTHALCNAWSALTQSRNTDTHTRLTGITHTCSPFLKTDTWWDVWAHWEGVQCFTQAKHAFTHACAHTHSMFAEQKTKLQ